MRNENRIKIGQFVLRLVSAFLLLGLAFAVSAAPVKAGPVVFDNYSVPVNWEVYNPCAAGGTGETIALSGNMHVLFFDIYNNTRSTVQKSQVNMQGVSGIGQSTGTNYRAVGMGKGMSTVMNETDVYTSVDNQRFIGAGAGDNFHLHMNFHLTVNANGEVTADNFNYSIECR